MKNLKINLLGLLGGIIFLLPRQVASQAVDETDLIRCGATEYMNQMYRRHPAMAQDREELEKKISVFLHKGAKQGRLKQGETEIITIPVVVHVIHDQRDNTIGGAGNPNISDEQIKNQIRILNEDFRKMPGTPGSNDNPVGVDTRIEFFLANTDPNGLPATGITRTYDDQESFELNSFSRVSNISYWPSDRYLNIWVCRISGKYLGSSQFPSVRNVPGLDDDNADSPETDGVMIDFEFFGRGGTVESRTYNQGRTTTHEIGHWFGLIHTWGDEHCGTDYCDDTPRAETSNQTTLCQVLYSKCNSDNDSTRNMTENYLDYSPDRCMNIFTADQSARMHAILELSPRRRQLVEAVRESRLEPTDNLTVELSPNPITAGSLAIEAQFPDYQEIKFKIYTSSGRLVWDVSYPNSWSRRFEIPLTGILPGIYVVKILAAGQATSRRFIVP